MAEDLRASEYGIKRVGLISDTHGTCSPGAVRALEDEHPLVAIVHAGDIGADPGVLYALEGIAPVIAVLGNCDVGLPGFDLGGVARLRVGTARILVVHDFADLGPIPSDVDAIVCGHSHVASIQWHDRVLVVNPGSATQCRRQDSCSVAVLEVAEEGALSARLVMLDE
jgi:putative phosphoesterase